MVGVTDERMPPLDITRIQKNLEKQKKKSRKQEFLKLFYSNPQKLIELIKDLYDDNTVSQQIKVNLYLQSETRCALSFLIEKCILFPEHVVKVIGSRELATRVVFEENNEFIKRLQDMEGPITLKKELLSYSLSEAVNSFLDDFQFSEHAICHFFPIFNPYRKNVIMYACLVQDAHVPYEMETLHGYIGECFRYCQEIVVNAMRFDEQKQQHSKRKKMLELGICNLDLLDNFKAFILALRSQILEITESERCNLFLLDGKYLVSRICDHGVAFDTFKKGINNVRIPVGVGVKGTVAETGEVINCLDLQRDRIYRKDLDLAAGLLSRNLLCFPLMLYDRVYAVAEVFNKTTSNIFSAADMNNSEYLGRILGIQLYMALLAKKHRDDYSRRNLIDYFMLETIKAFEHDELNVVLECEFRHDFDHLADYMFITSSVPNDHNMCTCLHMFEDLNLLQKFGLDRSDFTRFLLTVRNRLQEFSFHGWQHAFNTLHFIYTLVKKENLLHNDIISTMECICVFLAALCHEMEYRGPVNVFKPTRGLTLGSLYSSAGSVVQFHSIDQTIRLLNAFEITNNLELKKFKEFLILLDTLILGMDLGNHIYSRTSLKKLIDEHKMLKQDNRRHYFGILLTCSDISDFCKPWAHLEVYGAKICDEFFIEEVPQESYGLIEFSDMFENVKLKKLMLQIHFMQTICEPAFSLLGSLLPKTDKCSESIENNSKNLLVAKEKLIQAQLEHS